MTQQWLLTRIKLNEVATLRLCSTPTYIDLLRCRLGHFAHSHQGKNFLIYRLMLKFKQYYPLYRARNLNKINDINRGRGQGRGLKASTWEQPRYWEKLENILFHKYSWKMFSLNFRLKMSNVHALSQTLPREISTDFILISCADEGADCCCV